MANGLYAKGKEGFLGGDIALDTDNIRAILVDTGAYTVNLGTHDFLDDIPAGARIAVSGNMSGKTITSGVFDASDTTFSAVAGTSVEAVVVYQHTGVEGTSRLIAYIDTGTNLPVTPNGGDIIVQWHASGIFSL